METVQTADLIFPASVYALMVLACYGADGSSPLSSYYLSLIPGLFWCGILAQVSWAITATCFTGVWHWQGVALHAFLAFCAVRHVSTWLDGRKRSYDK